MVKQQVNLMVEESTVEQWDQYVEEKGFSSRAQLITEATSTFVGKGLTLGGVDPSESTGTLDVSDELLTELDNIKTLIRTNNDRLVSIDRELSTETEPDVDPQTVLAVVPKQQYRMEPIPDADGGGKVREDMDPSEFAPTAEDIATDLGEPVPAVDEQLQYLADDMGVIERVPLPDGTGRHYHWREDQ